jgi:PAS domain-containing protein
MGGRQHTHAGPTTTFSGIARLAAAVCATPVAGVGFVDDDALRLVAAVGLPAGRTALPAADVACLRDAHDASATVIADLATDPRSCHDAARWHGLRSYAGVPFRGADGEVLGAVFAADHRPGEITASQLALLADLAVEVEATLAGERTRARLRDALAAATAAAEERDRRRQQLRATEELLVGLADAAGDWVWRKELWPDERYVYVNDALVAGSGVARERWLADPAISRRHLHPDDLAELDASRAADDPWWPREVRWRRPDGTWRYLALRQVVARDETGRIVAVQGLAADVTAQRELTDRLTATAAHEREVADQLRELDRATSAILSAVSHRVRTPLSVLQGVAETLRARWRHLDDETCEHLLERLWAHAVEFGEQLDDLLDLEQLLSRTGDEPARPVDLATFVPAAVRCHWNERCVGSSWRTTGRVGPCCHRTRSSGSIPTTPTPGSRWGCPWSPRRRAGSVDTWWSVSDPGVAPTSGCGCPACRRMPPATGPRCARRTLARRFAPSGAEADGQSSSRGSGTWRSRAASSASTRATTSSHDAARGPGRSRLYGWSNTTATLPALRSATMLVGLSSTYRSAPTLGLSPMKHRSRYGIRWASSQ